MRHSPRGARRLLALAAATTAASLPALAPTTAQAQKWSFDSGVGAQLTWSSNPELGVAGGRDDTILDVRPHFTVRAEGPRVRLAGSAALNAIGSANGTQASRVLPEADLTGRVQAIDRFMFVEAGVRAQQISANPFGARPEAATNLNTLTATQVHLSPTIESSIDPFTRYRVRSDNSWTRESSAGGIGVPAASAAEGYFGRHSMLVEHDPRPLGWRLEAERQETRYRDNTEPLTFDLARATVDYTVGNDWIIGVHAGRERTSLLPEESGSNIYGAQARWQPSPLTSLSAFEEKRFFGKSWRAAFEHHTARIAWSFLVSRSLDTTPQSLFELPPVDNVTALLDTMLATRFPDPIERAKLVQDLIARQSLPTQTLVPINIFAQRVSIVTTRTASATLIGVRNSINVTAFQTRAEDVPQATTLLAAAGDPTANNTQYGASLTLTHRFSPNVSGSASVDWSRIRAIQVDDTTIQRSARVRLNVQAAPRTQAFLGGRYRQLGSNVAAEGNESAVFVGLDHRF